MATAELARGHTVTVEPYPYELTIFMLMKEFGGTPSQWKKETAKDIRAVTTILSTYNNVRNAEIQKVTKKGNRGIMSNMPVSKSKIPGMNKFIRTEKSGPQGISYEDTPI